ncbi:MerR family transcriptional regulator [Tsukamurella sp. 8F]|uniref:MerR family transcriptional regulator n=1 Tax=unclassified Tsukamurella TaxID=2633480 RepID=UPI0023B980A6|nr:MULTISPECIES: MerR family transcriptional regulator [unclassified Tsukamurella]MDF0531879.1 MerR family transcriptional regulator [Tsukamurella sp. 8J]MDF0589113.1 MerR family transcriptional regulator [Tsukamurella sp. 8F]
MRIGRLAERTGASVRSLRYYEEQGLLRAERSASGQRTYTEDAIDRVELLKQLYTAGLTSRVIAELLPCVHSPSIENNDDAFARLVDERRRLEAHIEDLEGTLHALDQVIAANRRWRSTAAS